MRVLPPIFLILSVAQAAACSLINAPDDPAMPESRTSCDGGACESDDPCEVCAPEARCARIDGGAVCTCPEDHEDPRGDGTRCHPLQECRPDADDCAGGRVCVEDGGGASCRCPDGHEGAGEECRDVDECAERLHDCSPAARCVNTEGAFRCLCEPGYHDTLGDGRQCDDVDECAQSPSPCVANARCANLEGSFECTCVEGYEGDGERSCVDTDECESGALSCPERSICEDRPGPDRCACDAYYRDRNGDGRVCDDDRVAHSIFFPSAVQVYDVKVAAPRALRSGGAERLVVAGTFLGELTEFCSEALRSGLNRDMYVAVLDGAYSCRWARRLGTVGPDRVVDLAIDADGNVLLLLLLPDSLAVDDETLGAVEAQSCQLLKLDPSGALDWARPLPCVLPETQLDGNPLDRGGHVMVDAEGEIYTTFLYGAESTIGSLVLPQPAVDSIAVLKLSAHGAPLWARTFRPGSSTDAIAYLWSFDLDADGDSLLAATFTGTVDFGEGIARSLWFEPYVVALDGLGNTRWTRAFPPGDNLLLSDIKVAEAGSDGHVLTAIQTPGSHHTEVVVRQISDQDGSDRWVTPIGAGELLDYAIAGTPEGGLTLAGNFSGEPEILGAPYRGDLLQQWIYLARLTPDGRPQWVHSWPNPGNSWPLRMEVSPTGSTYLTGVYTPAVEFGPDHVGQIGNHYMLGLRP